MNEIYKVRRKSDGLFAYKHPWKKLIWNEKGSIWKSQGALTLAFREGTLRGVKRDSIEVVVFEMVETGTRPWRIEP